jgi:hypothetical protein
MISSSKNKYVNPYQVTRRSVENKEFTNKTVNTPSTYTPFPVTAKIPLVSNNHEENISISLPNKETVLEQPILSVPKLVDNQTDMGASQEFSKTLKTSSHFIVCPHCKNQGHTTVKLECSLSSTAFAAFLGIGWGIWQFVRNKDLNCYFAEHSCSICKNQIYKYNPF